MAESPKQFVVRFPGDMRDRIAQRATAAGRSMNSEIIAMLGRGLGEMPVTDLKSLYHDGMALEEQIRVAETDLAQKRARLRAIHEQIREHIGEDMGEYDPLQYAWVYMEERGLDPRED